MRNWKPLDSEIISCLNGIPLHYFKARGHQCFNFGDFSDSDTSMMIFLADVMIVIKKRVLKITKCTECRCELNNFHDQEYLYCDEDSKLMCAFKV